MDDARKVEALNSLCKFNEKTMEMQNAVIERLRRERDEALVALQSVIPLLDKVWDYDADVFGILHNDAMDVEAHIKRIIAAAQDAGQSDGQHQ